jgi:hypothetical protein
MNTHQRLETFRGFSKETGDWLYGDLIQRNCTTDGGSPLSISVNGQHPIEVAEESVGRMIKTVSSFEDLYEGDIVEVVAKSQAGPVEVIRGFIYFDKNDLEYVVENLDESSDWPLLSWSVVDRFKIVGKLHEEERF